MKKIEIFEWVLVFIGALLYFLWASANNFDFFIIIIGCIFSGFTLMVAVKLIMQLFND